MTSSSPVDGSDRGRPMKLDLAHASADERVAPFAAVLDRDEFRRELDRLCRSRWGTPPEARVRALKRHRLRCTFEIVVRTERGWRSVVGKGCTTDRADVFATMAAPSQTGFGPEAEFSIPEPLACLPSLGVRLEEEIEGPSAKEILLKGRPPERLAAAERCGRWLGRFHGPAPRVATAVDPRCRRWADQVASVGEPLARKAADVGNAAAAVLNQVPSKTPSRVPARVADSRAVAFDRAAQGFGVACAVVTVNRRPGCSLRSRQRARLARGASLRPPQDGESSRRVRWISSR